MSEREHHIKVLEKLLKETKGKIELYSENKNIDLTKEKEIVETLGYAISSLKTDLKYNLMYEDEEVYTEDEVIVMLTELKTEIEKQEYTTYYLEDEDACGFNYGITASTGFIEDKIDKLKENKQL